MRQRLDFYGLNFYNAIYDNAEEVNSKTDEDHAEGDFPARPKSYPEAIYKVLHMLVEKYQVDIPIYVTENGWMQADSDNLEELLDDQERIPKKSAKWYCDVVKNNGILVKSNT